MSSDSDYGPSHSPSRLRDKYRYIIRRCLYCGKSFGKKWKQHWERQHPGAEPVELQAGHHPIGESYLSKRGIFPKSKK